jgi:hypothetical protein
MKPNKFLILSLSIILAIIIVWYWADKQDFFQTNYNNISTKEQHFFNWQDGDSGETLQERYRKHFLDSNYFFPHQNVTTVKLYNNNSMFSVISGKTLKQGYVENFIEFCNDTTNFDWSETTWEKSDSDYYCNLYNENGKVVGKIYFCLEGCSSISSLPFSPKMKFGGLSEKGLDYIYQLLRDKTKWE